MGSAGKQKATQGEAETSDKPSPYSDAWAQTDKGLAKGKQGKDRAEPGWTEDEATGRLRGMKYECECGFATNFSVSFQAHVRNKHSSAVNTKQKAAFRCELCDVDASSKQGLRQHLEGHSHRRLAELHGTFQGTTYLGQGLSKMDMQSYTAGFFKPVENLQSNPLGVMSEKHQTATEEKAEAEPSAPLQQATDLPQVDDKSLAVISATSGNPPCTATPIKKKKKHRATVPDDLDFRPFNMDDKADKVTSVSAESAMADAAPRIAAVRNLEIPTIGDVEENSSCDIGAFPSLDSTAIPTNTKAKGIRAGHEAWQSSRISASRKASAAAEKLASENSQQATGHAAKQVKAAKAKQSTKSGQAQATGKADRQIQISAKPVGSASQKPQVPRAVYEQSFPKLSDAPTPKPQSGTLAWALPGKEAAASASSKDAVPTGPLKREVALKAAKPAACCPPVSLKAAKANGSWRPIALKASADSCPEATAKATKASGSWRPVALKMAGAADICPEAAAKATKASGSSRPTSLKGPVALDSCPKATGAAKATQICPPMNLKAAKAADSSLKATSKAKKAAKKTFASLLAANATSTCPASDSSDQVQRPRPKGLAADSSEAWTASSSAGAAAEETVMKDYLKGVLECPITLETMRDPVTLVGDGHTYERSAIEAWLARGDAISPMTGEELTEKLLIPNLLLKRYAEQLLEQM